MDTFFKAAKVLIDSNITCFTSSQIKKSLETNASSKEFIKNLYRIGILNILYRRLEVEQEGFIEVNHADVPYVTCAENSCNTMIKLYRLWIAGIVDAIDQNYLEYVYLILKNTKNGKFVELYKFYIDYKDVIMTKSFEEQKEETKNLLKFLYNLKYKPKLDEDTNVVIILLYRDTTPDNYIPILYQPADNNLLSTNWRLSDRTIQTNINTGYHELKVIAYAVNESSNENASTASQPSNIRFSQNIVQSIMKIDQNLEIASMMESLISIPKQQQLVLREKIEVKSDFIIDLDIDLESNLNKKSCNVSSTTNELTVTENVPVVDLDTIDIDNNDRSVVPVTDLDAVDPDINLNQNDCDVVDLNANKAVVNEEIPVIDLDPIVSDINLNQNECNVVDLNANKAVVKEEIPVIDLDAIDPDINLNQNECNVVDLNANKAVVDKELPEIECKNLRLTRSRSRVPQDWNAVLCKSDLFDKTQEKAFTSGIYGEEEDLDCIILPQEGTISNFNCSCEFNSSSFGLNVLRCNTCEQFFHHICIGILKSVPWHLECTRCKPDPILKVFPKSMYLKIIRTRIILGLCPKKDDFPLQLFNEFSFKWREQLLFCLKSINVITARSTINEFWIVERNLKKWRDKLFYDLR